jgi:hypothetical protein
MDIVEQIADMLVLIEQEAETRQEVYNVLLLAFLEIKKLRYSNDASKTLDK